MTHCDSGSEFQDTPHGSVRCFHLEGGGCSGAFNRLTGTKQSEAVKWFHALWTETLFVTMVAAHLTSRQGGKKIQKKLCTSIRFWFSNETLSFVIFIWTQMWLQCSLAHFTDVSIDLKKTPGAFTYYECYDLKQLVFRKYLADSGLLTRPGDSGGKSLASKPPDLPACFTVRCHHLSGVWCRPGSVHWVF